MKVLAARPSGGADVDALRTTLDQLKNKLGSALIMLASDVDGKVTLLAWCHQRPDRQSQSRRCGKRMRAPTWMAVAAVSRKWPRPAARTPAGIDDALAAFSRWAEAALSA